MAILDGNSLAFIIQFFFPLAICEIDITSFIGVEVSRHDVFAIHGLVSTQTSGAQA